MMKLRNLFLFLTFSLGACEINSKKNAEAQQETDFLSLSPGDKWGYRVKLITDISAKLPESNLALNATSTETSYQTERIYIGLRTPTSKSPAAHCFEEIKDGKTTDTEYLLLTPDKIQILGWKGEEMPAPVLFKTPVTIFSTRYETGTEWEGIASDSKGRIILERRFRHHGKELIHVPAGKFEAIKIEEYGRNLAVEISRFCWYVKGLGIVKEEGHYYSKKRRLFYQVKELESYLPKS